MEVFEALQIVQEKLKAGKIVADGISHAHVIDIEEGDEKRPAGRYLAADLRVVVPLAD